MSESPSRPPRHMKFPYTFGAKVAQFPYKFYYKNNWFAKYYPIGVLCTLPVIMYINGMVNTPENKAKWAEIHRKEAEGHH